MYTQCFKSATSYERREPALSVTGCESTRIDSQTEKNKSENANDRFMLVNAKDAKGGKSKYTCAICLDVIIDSTP